MSDQVFDGDREFVGPYLRYLADQMGLRDWFLYHGHSTPQDEGHGNGVAGTCDPEEHRKSATIRFRDDWRTWEEDQFRHVSVHELLHCHFAHIRQPLNDAQELIGGLLFAPMWDAMTHSMEIAIDGIAYDWARKLPLPTEWLEAETNPEAV